MEKGLAAGLLRYLTKPIKVDEFMDTLDVAFTFAKTQSARANIEKCGVPRVENARLPATEATTAATRRRILVVDDNRDSANSLAMLLTMSGHETHTAHDGLDAVAAAARFRPDVVLLDIGLPKLNGYDAARRIREESWGKVMILVALTGWGQEEDRRKSKDAGFDHHLVKPVEHAALTKLLGELPSAPA